MFIRHLHGSFTQGFSYCHVLVRATVTSLRSFERFRTQILIIESYTDTWAPAFNSAWRHKQNGEPIVLHKKIKAFPFVILLAFVSITINIKTVVNKRKMHSREFRSHQVAKIPVHVFLP